MTGRVLYILREHGDWQTVKDLHELYQVIIEHGFDPDDMDNNSLRLTAESFVKTDKGYIYKIFWVPNYERERKNNV